MKYYTYYTERIKIPLFVTISIILYHSFVVQYDPTKDILNYRIIKIGKQCCSYWPISHFVLFLILGYMYPNDFVFFTLLGILWELIEFTLSKTLRDGVQSVSRNDVAQKGLRPKSPLGKGSLRVNLPMTLTA